MNLIHTLESAATTITDPIEVLHLQHNRSLLALSALMIGLIGDDGRAVLNLNERPWKIMRAMLIQQSIDNLKEG